MSPLAFAAGPPLAVFVVGVVSDASLGVELLLGLVFLMSVFYLARSLKTSKTQEATEKARTEAVALAEVRGERIRDLEDMIARLTKQREHAEGELEKANAMIRDLSLADQSAVLEFLKRDQEAEASREREAERRHRELLAAIAAIREANTNGGK